MKKLISLLIVLATVFSLCACGGDPANTDTSGATEASTEASEPTTQTPAVSTVLTPEQLYGHINQLEPVDGVYKIWSDVGVQNMADHPDAKFELLCNVDMNGATVRPIGTADKPFTGEINGGAFTISNFTLQGGEEESFGFVTVNKGTIEKFLIKDVTFLPGANAKNIGSLVGTNEGQINRCTVSGTLNVENAPEGANCGGVIGLNTGSLLNTVAEVDLNVTTPGAANVGGLVGSTTGGTFEYNDTNGKLDVTGSNKSVGLFAGVSTDAVFTSCAFVGASNTVDGVLFTNFTGNPEDDELAVAYKGLWRDNQKEPLPENVQKLRDAVVQKMYDMGTIEWTVTRDLTHNCFCGTGGSCVGTYLPRFTYIGMPYKHGNGTLTSFQYCMNEDGTLKDWLYDMDEINGYDTYIGSMCSSAASMAWWTVSNTNNFMSSQYSLPYYYPNYGCIPVGEGWWEDVEFDANKHLTQQYIDNCTEQEFYQVLAQTHHGDLMTDAFDLGYHTVMIAEEPVVVRDQYGNISGEKSYLVTHEQGAGFQRDEINMVITTWGISEKNTFEKVRDEDFCPFTCEELLTGEMEPVECTMLDNPGGKLGMTVGTVKANYFLETVTLKITDSQGNVVLDKTNFPKAGKFDDANTKQTSLCYIDSYDMAYFCTPLQNIQLEPGETYSYSVSAHLATGDDFVLLEDSFVNGGTAG